MEFIHFMELSLVFLHPRILWVLLGARFHDPVCSEAPHQGCALSPGKEMWALQQGIRGHLQTAAPRCRGSLQSAALRLSLVWSEVQEKGSPQGTHSQQTPLGEDSLDNLPGVTDWWYIKLAVWQCVLPNVVQATHSLNYIPNYLTLHLDLDWIWIIYSTELGL